jgi:hypothetical protein
VNEFVFVLVKLKRLEERGSSIHQPQEDLRRLSVMLKDGYFS